MSRKMSRDSSRTVSLIRLHGYTERGDMLEVLSAADKKSNGPLHLKELETSKFRG
jgi:hypothetical protein